MKTNLFVGLSGLVGGYKRWKELTPDELAQSLFVLPENVFELFEEGKPKNVLFRVLIKREEDRKQFEETVRQLLARADNRVIYYEERGEGWEEGEAVNVMLQTHGFNPVNYLLTSTDMARYNPQVRLFI